MRLRTPTPAPAPTLPDEVTRYDLPHINLLPRHIHVQRQFARVQAALGAAIVAALLLVLLLSHLAAGREAAEQRRLDAAQRRNASLQRQVGAVSGVQTAYNAVNTARNTERVALGTEVRFSRLLAALSTHVPASVQVATLAYTEVVPGITGGGSTAPSAGATSGATVGTLGGSGTQGGAGTGTAGIGTVVISGLTASHDDVATWLDSLAAQTGLVNPVFSTSTASDLTGRLVVTFQSSATLATTALSGRYSGPDGGLK